MANTVAKIQAVLDLDTGKFSGSVTSAIGQVKAFNATVNSTDKSIKNIERRVTSFGSSVRDSAIMLGQFRAAIQTVWLLTGQWVGSIIEANAKLERLQVLMNGLAKGSTAAAKTAAALKDMSFVLTKAQNAPFALDQIANAFVKLKSAGIDPTKGAMDALVDSVAAFGGDDQTLHRATVAVQQMAGKGVISMEELRQQLGEAVPNAMQLMARSMNMTMAQLVKAISLGRVEAKGALERLFREMHNEYAGAGERLMTTWTGMLSKLKTQWLIFAQEIGKQGMFEGAKDALQELITFLGSNEGVDFARDIGRGLADAIKAAADLSQWLIKNRDTIITTGKLIVQAFAVVKIAKFSSAIVVGIANLASLRTSLIATRAAAIAAAAGTGAWSAAIAAAAGPIGIAVGLIGGLVVALNNQMTAARQASNAMTSYYRATANGQLVTVEEQKAMDRRVDFLKRLPGLLEAARNHPYRVGRALAVGDLATQAVDMGIVDKDFNAATLRRGFTSIQDLADKLSHAAQVHTAAAIASHQTQATGLLNRAIAQNVATFGTALDAGMSKIGQRISKSQDELFEKFNTGKISKEEFQRERDANATAVFAAQEKWLKQQREALGIQLHQVSDNEAATRTVMDMMKLTDEKLKALGKDRAETLLAINSDPKLMAGMGADKTGGSKANPLAEYLQQVIGKQAQLQAQLDGGIPNLEKFKALLGAGQFGKNPDSGIVGQIEAILTSIDDLTAKVKAQKATEALTNQLEDLAAKSESDVMVNQLQKTSRMYDEVSSSMAQFRRQLAGYRNDLGKTNMTQKEFDDWVKKISKNLAQIDFDNLKAFVKNAEWESYLDSLPKRARDLAEFTRRLEENEAMVKQMQADNEGDPARQAEIAALGRRNADAIRQDYENASKSSWQTLIDGWLDTTTQIDDAWASGMQSLNDHMLEFLTTGKANWRDFATDVIKQIGRILLSKALAKLANFIVGLFGGGIGVGLGGGGSGSDLGGGIAGGVGALFGSAKGNAFLGGAMLTKYANGGAFTNKLTSGTNIAPMAMFGEAGPEAIMPLSRDATGELGVKMHGEVGAPINNNVTITVTINQDGTGGESSSDNRANSKEGKALAQLLDARVRETMTAELRQGGILWRMQHGGL